MPNTFLKITIANLLIITSLAIKAQGNAASGIGSSGSEYSSKLRGSGMAFTPNKGQYTDAIRKPLPDVLYKGSGGDADIYLRKTGISYVQCNSKEVMLKIEEQIEELKTAGMLTEMDKQQKKDELMQKQKIKIHRVDMDFEGANENCLLINEDELDGYNNYYYPHCPNGITHVKEYNKVTYKNIYKDIDVTYYGDKTNGVKYDLIVQPHADPNQIKLHWKGAEKMKLESSKLKVESSLGIMTEILPKVYQNINGKIVDVECKYMLDMRCEMLDLRGRHYGSQSHVSCLKSHIYEVSFELGTYNLELPLIIDPWATYYGGSGNGAIGVDECRSASTDPSGNPLFVGYSRSVTFPTTVGAWQYLYGGIPTNVSVNTPIESNAWIVKFDPSGNRMFATYYGGYADGARDVKSDASGNILVVGTAMDFFPVGAASGYVVHQTNYASTTPNNIGKNAFVLKLDPNGLRLFATYYGGTGTDWATSVATDGTNIFLYGYTNSPTGIATAGSLYPILQGRDVFLVKFFPNGARDWGTYFGGTGNEEYGNCAYDPLSNSIYIIGNTGNLSAGFPILALPGNFVQMPTRPWPGCGFVTKLSVTGSPSIIWSTYYLPSMSSIAVDFNGDVIVVGSTQDNLGVGIAGAAQQPTWGGGNSDGFITKFNSVGQRLWGTYIGGNGDESNSNVVVDKNNNIFVLGEFEDTGAGNYKVSTCALQTTYGGGPEDCYIAKYTPAGKQTCVTYYGGAGEDDIEGGHGFAIYDNNLYVAGYTSGSFPVTPGAFQTTFAGGNYDAFFAQLCINICEAKTLGLAYSADQISVCPNVPIKFTPSVTNSCDTTGYKFLWTFAGGNPSTSTAVAPTVTFAGAGTHDVKLVLSTLCKKDSVIKPSYITVNSCGCVMSAAATVTANVSCSGANGSANVTITNGSGGIYTYNWSNGINGTTTASNIPLTGLSANTYTVTITDGSCASVSTVTITQPINANSVSHTDLTCSGGNNGSASVSISGLGGTYTYSWSNGVNTVTTSLSNTINTIPAGTYTVTVKQGSCSSTSTVTVTQPEAIIVGFSTKCSCAANKGMATVFVSNGTAPYTYAWSNGQTAITATGLSVGTTSVTITDAKGCTATRSVSVTTCPLTIYTTSSEAYCGPGTATVLGSSGIDPLTYSWSSGETTASISAPVPGNYPVTVTDATGCTATKTITVTGTNNTSVATFSQSPAGTVCAGTTVNFINTGSIGTYSWRIPKMGPVVSGSATDFTSNLLDISLTFTAVGTYTVSHTVNSSGCSSTSTSTLTVINCTGPIVSATGSSVCTGFCGTVTASNGSGGTPPYTYSWSNGSTSQNINPCPVSTTTYTVTIKDAGGKTSTSTAVVTVNPAVTVNTTSTNSTCSGTSTGSATASGTGGTSPYTFNWSTGATGISTSSMSIVNLTAGTYTVTITDNKGCTASASTTFIAPSPLIGQFAKGTAACSNCGCQEWILVNAINGTPPYTYLWPDGYDKRYKNKICPGTYLVKVTDKNGCSVDVNVGAP